MEGATMEVLGRTLNTVPVIRYPVSGLNWSKESEDKKACLLTQRQGAK